MQTAATQTHKKPHGAQLCTTQTSSNLTSPSVCCSSCLLYSCEPLQRTGQKDTSQFLRLNTCSPSFPSSVSGSLNVSALTGTVRDRPQTLSKGVRRRSGTMKNEYTVLVLKLLLLLILITIITGAKLQNSDLYTFWISFTC